MEEEKQEHAKLNELIQREKSTSIAVQQLEEGERPNFLFMVWHNYIVDRSSYGEGWAF